MHDDGLIKWPCAALLASYLQLYTCKSATLLSKNRLWSIPNSPTQTVPLLVISTINSPILVTPYLCVGHPHRHISPLGTSSVMTPEMPHLVLSTINSFVLVTLPLQVGHPLGQATQLRPQLLLQTLHLLQLSLLCWCRLHNST